MKEKELNLKDSDFVEWIKKDFIFFRDNNYFTKILNFFLVNEKDEFNKNIIEQFIFYLQTNKKKIKNIKENLKNIEVEEFFNKNYNNSLSIFKDIYLSLKSKKLINVDLDYLIVFFEFLQNYRKEKIRDFKKEYQIVKKYWLFIDYLLKKDLINFNEILILINKNTFISQKGIILCQ